MKVLGISAAATPKGRSEILLDSLLSEFRDDGFDVKKILVRDLKISFCGGLRCCEKTGRCKFIDDMQLLEEAISSADVIVVSTPIYFTSVPAKLKAIVDRCQVYWVRKNILKLLPPEKKGFFISVAGQSPDFKHAEAIVRAFFSVFNIKFCGRFYLPDTDKLSSEQFDRAIDDVRRITNRVAIAK